MAFSAGRKRAERVGGVLPPQDRKRALYHSWKKLKNSTERTFHISLSVHNEHRSAVPAGCDKKRTMTTTSRSAFTPLLPLFTSKFLPLFCIRRRKEEVRCFRSLQKQREGKGEEGRKWGLRHWRRRLRQRGG